MDLVGEVSAWMREHCAIDLHDAAGFDLLEIAKARLREDPARVNLRIDQWDLPQGAPLHYAVKYKHTHMAELLLENGADPNLLAGDGQSPLDLAEADDAKDAAALLMQLPPCFQLFHLLRRLCAHPVPRCSPAAIRLESRGWDRSASPRTTARWPNSSPTPSSGNSRAATSS
ncbi:MAG: ankyrin repeat domain-containing protein [Planctomycetes bacterium]|nr:ankyrin repeat domain-containing protein [Planctomycetota bacterium]